MEHAKKPKFMVPDIIHQRYPRGQYCELEEPVTLLALLGVN